MRDHESAQQVAAREDGAIREEENNQQRARRNAPEVLEHKSAQRALQERIKWFEIASQDDKRQQDQIGPLIWHAST